MKNRMQNRLSTVVKGFALYLLLGGLFLLSACQSAAITPQTPPTIVYGEDVCEHCGMIINDERFAAALVLKTESQGYEHRIFDDIGDMFAFVQEYQAANQHEDNTTEIATYFVHDYVDGTWLNAQEAYFVQAKTLNTPMGSGVVAFASKATAEEQAQLWDSVVMDFDGMFAQATLSQSHAQH